MSLYYSLLFLSIIGSSICSARQKIDGVSNTSLWPVPAFVSLSGAPLPISRAFVFTTSSGSSVLKRGMIRYLEIILQQVGGNMEYLDESDQTLDELVFGSS
ncbi:hypothetical protein OS493_025779 [Desmophyllum pertusum]|uniref:Uncharacterized protein n=1 Tax=Desmophyllum pertusum TaxID=174260 RepID=A0A9W9ZAK8_9CNID|nr:hypothetical protein OS493_025779 [Desmophyllum pertusum]